MVKQDKKFTPNNRLHNARKERGWSQEMLAEKVGTTLVNVSRWENGVTFPSPYFRGRLCEVFGKTLRELGLVPPDSQTPDSWNIPITRNPLFIGREELLATLHRKLLNSKVAALFSAQALYGLGGVGKTQTAAEYAFRYGEHYAYVFWMRAADRTTLSGEFVLLAQRLDLPEKGEQEQERVIAAVKRWFTAHDNWLLILDNADDLVMARGFLPKNYKGYVLYTTRSRATGSVAESIEVERLSPHDGTLLLLRWIKLLDRDTPLDKAPAVERALAEHIVKEMEGLPLAIVQAGAYIEETGCSLADYLHFYETHRKELLARHSQYLFDYHETVATTWLLSFQQIEQINPAAAELLRLCAFLAPDAIPEELLTKGAAGLGSVLAPVAADAFNLNEALEVLRRYSLLRRSKGHMLSIHRLVQAVLKEDMDFETGRTWTERAIRALNAAFPEQNDSTMPSDQYYLPHIQKCVALVEEYHLSFPEAGQLFFRAGDFLYYHGLYKQSQSLHQLALTTREQVFGREHLTVAKSYNELAILARVQGDSEQAETFHLRTLAIRRKLLGENHQDVAQSLNNLGVLYRDQGSYERAEPLLKDALIIRQQLLGSEHPETLNSFTNLARLYLEQGEYERAELLLKQALTTFTHVLGPNHPYVALCLNLFARLSHAQRKYEQAEKFCLRSLVVLEKNFEREHPSVAEVLFVLAELYSAQGKYHQAQIVCQQALDICEKKFGSEHTTTTLVSTFLTKIASQIKSETGQ